MSNSSNFRKYESYQEKFRKSHQLGDFLNYFSAYVWHRLRLLANYSSTVVKADEPEFTNRLVSELFEVINEDKIPLPIRIIHAKNEKTKGNDIEIFIEISKDKYLRFPCQAKRLYVNNTKNVVDAIYREIWYKPLKSEIYQINALLNYGKTHLGYPLYMFYNFSEKEQIDPSYPNNELFGSTLVSAQYVAEQHFFETFTEKPRFLDLHPPGKPISSITTLNELNLNSIDSLWGKTNEQLRIKIYSYNEVFNEPGMAEFNPPSYVDKRFIFSDKSLSEILSNNQITSTETYNPKFRIVITKEPILHRKRNIKP